jgi:hypothetical protein
LRLRDREGRERETERGQESVLKESLLTGGCLLSSSIVRCDDSSDVLLSHTNEPSSPVREINVIDPLFVSSEITLDNDPGIVIAFRPIWIDDLRDKDQMRRPERGE